VLGTGSPGLTLKCSEEEEEEDLYTHCIDDIIVFKKLKGLNNLHFEFLRF
jgi:hypothetical protein